MHSPDPATAMAMGVLYGVLALVSAAVNRWSPRQGALRLQVHAWWRLFPVVSLAWLLHPWGAWLLWLSIGVLAARELGPHLDPNRDAAPRAFHGVCAAVMALQAGFMLCHPRAPWTVVCMPLACLGCAGVFAWRRRRRDLLHGLFVLTCTGTGFMVHLQQVAGATVSPTLPAAWFFFLMTTTALNDIAQFVSGKLFGKQKIARHISPNKTWQGLMGGILVTMALSWGLGGWLQLADASRLLVLGALLSVVGFAGDLVYSAAKRAMGIKDFSDLIPGHGGILDRVDSLVLTAPLLYAALRWTPLGAFS